YFETMFGAVERRLVEEHGFRILEPTKQATFAHFTKDDEEALTRQLHFHLLDKRLARERDASSVAETLRLRGGAHVPVERIDACKVVFLTSNGTLQGQSRDFLVKRKLITREEFSPIITDRFFCGLAWLLYGGKSGDALPTAKLLA